MILSTPYAAGFGLPLKGSFFRQNQCCERGGGNIRRGGAADSERQIMYSGTVKRKCLAGTWLT